jgi:cellulose synthase operon protein C
MWLHRPRGRLARTGMLIAVLSGIAFSNLEADEKSPRRSFSAAPVFEKANDLVRQAQSARNPQAQAKAMRRAAEILATFTEANPDHPEAGRVHSRQGTILLQQGRAIRAQASAEMDPAIRAELQTEARRFIDDAEAAFEQAHALHQAEFKQFPAYIAPEDAEPRAAKQKAELAYVRAQFDLAKCHYERSQTYDHDNPERMKLLSRGAQQFETVHKKYRTLGAGLYARMWQAKCLEEQGEPDLALDIYQQLLRHQGDSQFIKQFQTQVRYFRLICLNDDRKQDYQLAIDEATAWLDENKSQAESQMGLAIRYERLRAGAKLASRPETPNRKEILNQALTDAEFLAGQPGRFREAASRWATSIREALDERSKP